MNIAKAISNLLQLKQNINNIIAEKIVENTLDNFESESFFGNKWKPRKNPDSKKNRGRALLVKTGRLRRSIRPLNMSEFSVEVGSNVEYAKYQNEGTQHIPQRKFIGESKRQDIIISNLIKRLIKRALK